MPSPTITWHATANVRIHWRDAVVWFDPWFTRHPRADPKIHATIDDVDDGASIFMSHGHFDHLQDVPSILARKPSVHVYCSATAKDTIHAQLVAREEVDAADIPACMERVHVPAAGDTITVGNAGVQVDVIRSEHVRFDVKSIARALFNWRTWRSIRTILADVKPYPKGDVFGYDVHLGDEARIVMFGSLCTKYPELLREHARPDVLLVPCAGRFDSDRIGLEIARHVQPRYIIPIHHDDFYPPISYHVPTRRLREGAAALDPPALYLELPVGQPVEVLAGR